MKDKKKSKQQIQIKMLELNIIKWKSGNIYISTPKRVNSKVNFHDFYASYL